MRLVAEFFVGTKCMVENFIFFWPLFFFKEIFSLFNDKTCFHYVRQRFLLKTVVKKNQFYSPAFSVPNKAIHEPLLIVSLFEYEQNLKALWHKCKYTNVHTAVGEVEKEIHPVIVSSICLLLWRIANIFFKSLSMTKMSVIVAVEITVTCVTNVTK